MKRALLIALLLAAPAPARTALRYGLGQAVAKRSAELINQAAASQNVTGNAVAATLPACTAAPYYTVSPIADADIQGIVPLGNLSPSGHTFPSDHIYFYLKPLDPLVPWGPRVTTTVAAPGDITVTNVASSEYLSATPSFIDYTIGFYSCRELYGVFGHIQTLDASFLAKFGGMSSTDCSTYSTGGATIRRCNKWTNFTVQASETIGTAGAPHGGALDYGTYDTRTTLTYVNPSRHLGSTTHTVCPLDYYGGAVKAQLQTHVGSYDGSIPWTGSNTCGSLQIDVTGTAIGYWYKAGQPNNPEDPHLALVHDYTRPTWGAISVGTSGPGPTRVELFVPLVAGFVDRDFRDVNDSNIYCYDNFKDPNGNPAFTGTHYLFQLTSATTIKGEEQAGANCGAGPWTFTGAAVTFQR